MCTLKQNTGCICRRNSTDSCTSEPCIAGDSLFKSFERRSDLQGLGRLHRKRIQKILESVIWSEDYEKLYADQDEIFQTLFFMDEKIAVSKAKHAAKKKSLKILPAVEFCVLKDFLQDGENWLELNATQHGISLKPIGAGQDVLIIIGEKLNEGEIRYYLE